MLVLTWLHQEKMCTRGSGEEEVSSLGTEVHHCSGHSTCDAVDA